MEEVKKLAGELEITVIRDSANGPMVMHREVRKNLMVNTGKRQTWRMACGLNANDWDQMRIGTCGAAAASGQTNVLSPVTGTIDTANQKTLLAGTRTFQLMISYPSGVSSKSATNIKEAVILNQNTSPGGSALARITFTPVTKTRSDKLKLVYSIRIT